MILDVFSDPICPWCYIGKRRLERCLGAMPKDARPRLRWRAFMLNPDMPAGGMERNAYLAFKFGGWRRASDIYRAIAEAGRQEGVAFAFGDIYRTPSTVAAHRAIAWAGERGAQDRMVEALFAAYFTDGIDIGDAGELSRLAARADLDRGEAAAFLAGDSGVDAVFADHNLAQRMGIGGAPCFVLDGRYAVSGAQSPEVLQRMIEAARETSAA